MPSVNTISGNVFSTTARPSWGNPSAYEPKTIIIPFKPVPQSQSEQLYDKKVNKEQKVAQLLSMGLKKEDLEFLLTMNDWGEIHVNPSKRTLIIGDLNGDRTETVYNSQGLPVKNINYYKNQMQVEEFKNGYRIFTEYERNAQGRFVKKYYEKSPEDDPTNIVEQHRY